MKHTAVHTADLKPIGIERLLEWSFGTEKAKLDHPAPGASSRVAIPRHLGYGSLWHSVLQMQILGCRVDTSQAGANFLAHEGVTVADDAEAVAAVISGMVGASMLERRIAQTVEHYAREGTRPPAMSDSEPAIEPAGWGVNPHGRNAFADSVAAKHTDFPGGVWRHWMDEARKSKAAARKAPVALTAHEVEMHRMIGHCTAVQYRPHPAQIRTARSNYLAWWQALHQVREALIEARVLKRHRLTHEMPPATPWLKPGEAGVTETGPRPDWRTG